MFYFSRSPPYYLIPFIQLLIMLLYILSLCLPIILVSIISFVLILPPGPKMCYKGMGYHSITIMSIPNSP